MKSQLQAIIKHIIHAKLEKHKNQTIANNYQTKKSINKKNRKTLRFKQNTKYPVQREKKRVACPKKINNRKNQKNQPKICKMNNYSLKIK